MRRLWIVMMIVLLALVACGGDDSDEGSDSESPSATPEMTGPTPTSPLDALSNNSLNALSQGTEDEDCPIETVEGEESDCLNFDEADTAVEAATPIPLQTEQLVGLSVGVPEGFEALAFDENEAVIQPIDTQAPPGEFHVQIHWRDAEGVEALLATYQSLDEDARTNHENAVGSGYVVPNGDLGVIGVWEASEDRYLVIEGFVAPGFWPMYAATYTEIVDTVRLLEES